VQILRSLCAFSLILLIAACGGSTTPPTVTGPTPQTVTIQNRTTERVAAEKNTPTLDNCGGSDTMRQTYSRGRNTTVTISLGLVAAAEATIQVVKANIEASLNVEEGTEVSAGNDAQLSAAPGTRVQHTIQWYETYEVGTAVYGNLSIPYRVRVGYDNDITAQNLGCSGSIVTPNIAPTLTSIPQPVITVTTPAPIIEPTIAAAGFPRNGKANVPTRIYRRPTGAFDDIVTGMFANDEVVVLSQDGDWYFVRHTNLMGTYEGWVEAEDITLTE
jgi:hypothetical protein